MMLIGLFAPLVLAAVQEVSPPQTAFRSGVFFSTGDVTTCPYEVLGMVAARIRPVMAWDDMPSLGDAYPKLAKKARSLGGDAVLHVAAGKPHMTVINLRTVTVTGRAVRFTDRTCLPRV